jgi:RNA polymerase sigma-70 factor, ECF subfamily
MSSAAPFAFDTAYIEALRHGDPATEAHFVEHFSPILLRTLRRKLRSADQARDLCQETFLRVLSVVRSGREVRQPERFGVFVMGVCQNVVRETYREQRRSVSLVTLETEPVGNFPSAYALMLAAETRDKVHNALARMHADEQTILQAMLLDEQNKDEICRRFGISRNYLRVLLFRAKKRFRSRVGKDLPQPTRRSRFRRNAEAEEAWRPDLADVAMLFAQTSPLPMLAPRQRTAALPAA